MSGNYTKVAEQGATLSFNFNISTDGTPWDLTSYTAAMQVRSSHSSATALLSLSTGSGITLDSSGNVYITASATTMANMPVGRWEYDVELTSAGGVVTRVLEGKFVVTPEVTQ